MLRRGGYLEQDIVEAPRLRREHRGHAFLAALDEEGNVHRAGACVASGPRLAGTSVGRMAVSTQRLPIHPGVGDGVNGLSAIQAATDGSSIQGRPHMDVKIG